MLEPSVGDGAFLGALEKLIPVDRITAFDIDEQAIARVRSRFGGATISNVPESYKARHRPAWFKVPITWLGEGFFFKRSHAYPRICVNEANVHVTDTAYSIKPIGEATMRGICYSFYNSLTLLMSEIEGRFYGGGV